MKERESVSIEGKTVNFYRISDDNYFKTHVYHQKENQGQLPMLIKQWYNTFQSQFFLIISSFRSRRPLLFLIFLVMSISDWDEASSFLLFNLHKIIQYFLEIVLRELLFCFFSFSFLRWSKRSHSLQLQIRNNQNQGKISTPFWKIT